MLQRAASVIREALPPPKNRRGRFEVRLHAALKTVAAVLIGAGAALLAQWVFR